MLTQKFSLLEMKSLEPLRLHNQYVIGSYVVELLYTNQTIGLEDKNMNNDDPHICLKWLCCYGNFSGEALLMNYVDREMKEILERGRW